MRSPYPTLETFAAVIRDASSEDIRRDLSLGGRLTLAASGALSTSYAPFEYINRNAKVVIVGITPGSRQATDALIEARRLLVAGADSESASRAAKATASFAGPMRENIAEMLDSVGLHRKMALSSSLELFASARDLVHYTSALRYPVFVNGKNYSGSSPRIDAHPLLRNQILTTLAEEAALLPDALWIPLGEKVEAALALLVKERLLPQSRVLNGLQHASPANIERILYFLGKKPRDKLSRKTNADRIDMGRRLAIERIAALPDRI